MYFKIADTAVSALRYYPYVEKTIGGEGPAVDDTPSETEPVDVNVTEETPTEGATEPVEGATEPVEGATEPVEGATEEPADTPGFGFVFGLVGLLAVVYLVRRNN